jgi:hypothetical protein
MDGKRDADRRLEKGILEKDTVSAGLLLRSPIRRCLRYQPPHLQHKCKFSLIGSPSRKEAQIPCFHARASTYMMDGQEHAVPFLWKYYGFIY